MEELVTRPRALDVSGARTDGELVATWLAGAPETTRVAYARDLAWWQARTGVCELAALRTTHIVAALDDAPGSPSTIARRVASLRSLCAHAARVGYLPANPCAALRTRRARSDLAARIVEPTDIGALFNAASSARDVAFVRLAYATGARVAELCALSWSDIRPRADGAAVVRLLGKGGRRRSVWIPPRTAAAVEALRAASSGRGAVFRARTGQRLSPRDAHRLVRRLAASAGLAVHLSPHWLRHAFASHAIESGAPLHQVAADLGHASVATTSRYLHARPSSGASRWLPLA